ncbi:MAG: ATP phosphoribosyltransferase, partial [Bacteroidota bacterium]
MNLLRLAVQKSGRLHEGSVELLRECGIEVSNSNGKLRALAANFPLEVFFLRDDDIPQYVEDGVADVGIVGQNIVFEQEKKVLEAEPLDFGKCRLSIAVPKSHAYEGVSDLQGLRIATTYPNLLGRFLQKNGVSSDIHQINGSVEIAPSIGLADAVCDLVSSGS